MKDIFPALVQRYATNKTLRLKGRQLVRAADVTPRNIVLPYVEVDGDLAETFKTFDSDLETWSIEFGYRGKSLKVDDADDWLEAMVETFETAKLTSGAFTTVGMRMIGQESPSREDDTFVASITFELMIQKARRSPEKRNA